MAEEARRDGRRVRAGLRVKVEPCVLLLPQEWNLMPQKVSEIPVDRVKPSSFALRDLDEAAAEELARSIRASGLLQPIMVKPTGDGYELIFGLHRLEACKRLGWKKSKPWLSISQARRPS